ncbi:MAG TPA: mechanosensitive ion channel family protein [Candidatus Acidoferrales bacterium]|nr:mechanosensitive ion channel family protein [Candidatus Acidoferrales bacterium]
MPSIPTWLTHYAGPTLRVLAIFLIAFIFIRILKAFTNKLVQLPASPTRAAQMREKQTRTLASLVYSLGVVAILGLAVLMVLHAIGFPVTEVEVVGGLASVAIGLGAQGLIKDFINGFFIVFEDQFVVGDIIQLNGEIGRVEHFTLRRTLLRNTPGALVTIPNSLIGQVNNLSRDWSQAFVDITVPSDESVGRALAMLEKIAGDFRQDADWSPALVDGPRVLGVESLSLDGTVLRLQVRTALNRKDDVARELRRRIKIAFEQSRIPLTHTHNVQLHGELPPSDQSTN